MTKVYILGINIWDLKYRIRLINRTLSLLKHTGALSFITSAFIHKPLKPPNHARCFRHRHHFRQFRPRSWRWRRCSAPPSWLFPHSSSTSAASIKSSIVSSTSATAAITTCSPTMNIVSFRRLTTILRLKIIVLKMLNLTRWGITDFHIRCLITLLSIMRNPGLLCTRRCQIHCLNSSRFLPIYHQSGPVRGMVCLFIYLDIITTSEVLITYFSLSWYSICFWYSLHKIFMA